MNPSLNVSPTPSSLTGRLFLTVAVANALGNLWIDMAGPSQALLANLTKPLLMPLLAFLLYSETRGRPEGTRPPSAFLYLALAFGWLGDVLLMLPEGLSSRLPLGAFIWGTGAFLLGHLCYIRVFLRGIPPADVFKPSRLLLALPLLVYGYMVFLALRGFLGTLAVPVGIYMAAVLANGFSAGTRWMSRPGWPSALALFGALLFLQSDSILAINRFIFVDRTGQPMPLASFMVMVTYALGQYWLVRSNILEVFPPPVDGWEGVRSVTYLPRPALG